MATQTSESPVQTLNIVKEISIDAPLDVVWDSILEEMGPANIGGGGSPMPMKLEPWPGGRWFRDLENNTGHLWGHIQVIKPPKLLEICGPLFMSYPAANHLQYRLTDNGGSTNLKLTHRAVGLIDPEHAKGVQDGWGEIISNIQKKAAKRAQQRG